MTRINTTETNAGRMTLDAKLASQIGDDVRHMFDHQALFQEARAELARLTAEVAKMGEAVSWYKEADIDGMQSAIVQLSTDLADAMNPDLAALVLEARALFLAPDPGSIETQRRIAAFLEATE